MPAKKVTRTVNNTFILCVLLYNFVQIFPDQLHGPEKDLLIGWLHMIQQALEKGILHHTPLADDRVCLAGAEKLRFAAVADTAYRSRYPSCTSLSTFMETRFALICRTSTMSRAVL